MLQTKFRWTKQALFMAEKMNLSPLDVKECEKYYDEIYNQIGGHHVLDWINSKFNKPNEPNNQ